MSKYRFFPLLFTAALLLTATWVKAQPQQGKILFESFSWSKCSAFADFDQMMRQIASDKKSKVIHFNHHLQLDRNDVLKSDGSSDYAGAMVAPTSGTSEYYWFGAVNRAPFASAGSPSERTEAGISDAGSSYTVNTNWVSDMEAAIDAASTSYPATITISDASLDTVTQHGTYAFIHARIKVTAIQSIPDKIAIHFAVIEDGIKTSYQPLGNCWPNVTHNDVVRLVTKLDSVVFANGAANGDTGIVNLVLPVHVAGLIPFNFNNMRLIGFLQESSNATDFHVVNTVQLIDDLATLPLPPKALALDQTGINDSTYNPGEVVHLSFNSTFLINGVHPFYSLDNGATWVPFAGIDSAISPINWTVPDTVTTQGKFKLVSVDDPTVTSTQSGNFKIARAAMVGWLHPDPSKLKDYDTVKGGTTYHLDWTKNGVSAVDVQFAYHVVAGSPVYTTISAHNTGTSFDWQTPDTAYIVDLRLVPAEQSVASQITHMTLTKSTIIPPNGVVNADIARDFAIRQVYPNPSTGQTITVQYTSTKQKAMLVELLDLLGHEVYDEHLMSMPNSDVQVSTAGLAPGSYFLRMSDGEQAITKRIEILK